MGAWRIFLFTPSMLKKFCISWLCIQVVLGSVHYYEFVKTKQQQEQKIATTLQRLEQRINDMSLLALWSLKELEHPLQQAQGNLQRIRLLLVKKIDAADNIVRFSWSGTDKHLRVSSVGGLIHNEYDLAHRKYIALAMQSPGKVFLSPVLENIMKERPTIVMAMGITTRSGEYLGTISATLHIRLLRKLLEQSTAHLPVDAGVFTPYGETIFSAGNNEALAAHYAALDHFREASARTPNQELHTLPHPYFTVAGQFSYQAQQYLLQQFLLSWLRIGGVFSVIMLIFFSIKAQRHYRRRPSASAPVYPILSYARRYSMHLENVGTYPFSTTAKRLKRAYFQKPL